MIQEHSFFSSPMTYFGTYQNLEDDVEEIEEEEWSFSSSWQISSNSNLANHMHPRIGIFIHWHDVSE